MLIFQTVESSYIFVICALLALFVLICAAPHLIARLVDFIYFTFGDNQFEAHWLCRITMKVLKTEAFGEENDPMPLEYSLTHFEFYYPHLLKMVRVLLQPIPFKCALS